MADEGFEYGHPLEPVDAEWPEEVRSLEVATAMADVSCKEKVSVW
jgi:hypothetical protein